MVIFAGIWNIYVFFFISIFLCSHAILCVYVRVFIRVEQVLIIVGVYMFVY